MNNINPLFESFKKFEKKLDTLTGDDRRAIEYARDKIKAKMNRADRHYTAVQNRIDDLHRDRVKTSRRIKDRRDKGRMIGGIIGSIGGLVLPTKHKIISSGVGTASGMAVGDLAARKIFNKADNKNMEYYDSRISDLSKKRHHIWKNHFVNLPNALYKLY